MDVYQKNIRLLVSRYFTPASYNKHDPSASIGQSVRWLYSHFDRPIIVGIAGPSGAGKTFLTRRLKRELGGSCLLLNQDRYFKRDYKQLGVSGHHPTARNRAQMRDGISQWRRYAYLFCYSNSAFLFPSVRNLYNFRIAVATSDLKTLIERRRRCFFQKQTTSFLRHFRTKTLKDIIRYTLPSLRFAHILYLTDTQQLFIHRKFLQTLFGQEIFYRLSLDQDGWNVLWKKDEDRFTENPSTLCRMALTWRNWQGRRIIELGAGATGRDAVEFINAGARYVGIEISSFAARRLAENIRRETGQRPKVVSWSSRARFFHSWRAEKRPLILVGDFAEALPFFGRCDLVFSYSSLHYFPPVVLQRTLKNVRRISSHFAVAVKTTSDRLAHQGDRLPLPGGGRIYENDTHRQVRFFFLSERFKNIVKKSDFRVVRIHVGAEEFDAAKPSKGRQSPFINILAQRR